MARRPTTTLAGVPAFVVAFAFCGGSKSSSDSKGSGAHAQVVDSCGAVA